VVKFSKLFVSKISIPDLVVGYNRCEIHYRTHAIGGLSENDFICAAKIDALMPTNVPESTDTDTGSTQS
jgi:hypothetical protein